MTKEEFRIIEKMCKLIWLKLSKSGDIKKPEMANIFHFNCPACEIVQRVPYEFYDKKSGFCKFCPIIFWRGKGSLACQHGDGDIDIYEKWRHASKKQRKILAKEISNLEWKWMKRYTDVEMPPYIINDSKKILQKAGEIE